MGLIHVFERGGEDYREYKKALKMAKKSIETLCELTDEMESEYGERGSSSSEDRGDYLERDGRVYRRMR